MNKESPVIRFYEKGNVDIREENSFTFLYVLRLVQRETVEGLKNLVSKFVFVTDNTDSQDKHGNLEVICKDCLGKPNSKRKYYVKKLF